MSRFVVLWRFVRHRMATGRRYTAVCVALLLSGISFVESAHAHWPTISIASGPAIKEGGTATFTLTAVPAPAKPLLVTVTIDQTGNFVPSGGTGQKKVTIDTNGSRTLEVETVSDPANDTNGRIKVSVLDENDYNLDRDGYNSSASVAVVKKVAEPLPDVKLPELPDVKLWVSSEHRSKVTVLAKDKLRIDEEASGSFSMKLEDEPADEVTVTGSINKPDVATISPASLTFTRSNWNEWQTVSVKVAKDSDKDDETVVFAYTVSGYGLSDEGRVTIEVRDTDARSSPDKKKATVQDTVAAVAAATVSNVTSNIGARFSAPSTGGASVSLANMPVVLGSDDRNYPGSVSLADRLDAFGGDPWQSRQRTMSGDELLRTSSFEVALGAAEGKSGNAPGTGSRITVWGRGDLQFFESGGGRKSGYDGDLVAGYLGADIAMDGGWLAGVAVSRIAAEADYTLADAGEGGSLEADLTNVHPYVRVAVDDRSEAWAILGLGRGEVTDAPDGNGPAKSKSDLSMRMASAGLRHRLATDMGIDLALLGDGSFATIETDDGVQSVAGISSDVWRARLGVEASHTSVWESGSSLASFLEVAGRRDGGDATEGWGLEVSPGLSFSDPGSGFSVEARIRALALHSVEDHDEYGASVTASLMPGADGLGLSMAVTPTWGASERALGEADANLFGRHAADRGRDALSLSSRVAYGIAAGRGVVSPFAELSLHRDDSRRMRIGSRYSLGSAVDLELFGARSGYGSGDPEHSVELTSRIRF